jgi:hypothetical protein
MRSHSLPPVTEPRRSHAGLILAAAVTLTIAGFSLIPLKLKRELGFDRTRHLHLASHCVAFATLAFVLRYASRRSSIWWALGISMAIGAALEILEHLAYGAPLEKRDIALDMAAACGGVLLARVLVRSSPR